jgi:hypothetical protein
LSSIRRIVSRGVVAGDCGSGDVVVAGRRSGGIVSLGASRIRDDIVVSTEVVCALNPLRGVQIYPG